MNQLAPSYLLPNILIGSIAVVAAMLFGVRRAIIRAELPLREHSRTFWSISMLLLTWFLAALFLSVSGFYQGASSRIPTIPFGLLIPIAAGVVLFRRWPLLRRIIESVPQSWIVSVQVYRVEGLIFLTLYAGGWLPRAFAWPAGSRRRDRRAACTGCGHRLCAWSARVNPLALGLEYAWVGRFGCGRYDRLPDVAFAAATTGA